MLDATSAPTCAPDDATTTTTSRQANLAIAVATIVALLVAFALRVATLASQSIWLDEGATVAFASQSIAEIISATLGREPNPPLYYLLVHAWMRLAGTSELALRFPSALAGVLTVVLVHRLGRGLVGRGTGLGAATLVAINPHLLWYAQEARMYALLGALATAVFLALLWADRRVGWRSWATVGTLLTLTLYTHFYGVFVWLAAGALVAGHWLWRRHRPTSPAAVLAIVAPITLFMPWLIVHRPGTTGGPNWRQPLGVDEILGRSVTSFVHGGFLPDSVGGWLATAEVVLIVAGLLLALRHATRGAMAVTWLLVGLALPLGTAAVLAQVEPIFAERYVTAQAPLFCLAVAAGVSLTLRRLPIVQVATYAAIAVVGLWAIAIAWNDPQFRKEDFRSTAAYLHAHATADDVIIVVADYVAMPFTYYYRGPATVVPFAGEFARLDDVLPEITADNDRVWLLLSHAEQADPDGRVHPWLAARLPTVTEQYPKGIHLYGYRAASRLRQLPDDVTRVEQRFGPIELVGYHADTAVPATDSLLHPPSNWVHVVLYWRALAPVDEDYRSSVRIADGRGVWGDRLRRPGDALATYPTTRWQLGEIVVEDVDVNLNPAMPPGEFQLQVQLLTAAGQTVVAGEPHRTLGPIRIVESPPARSWRDVPERVRHVGERAFNRLRLLLGGG